MTDTDATRLSGGNSDAARLAGESYRTRLAPGTTTAADDKTRLAQEGYHSKLARDAANEQPDASEFYKLGDKIGDRYEVSAIHHGAMGVVYGCFDHQTKLPRALKTVRSRHLHDKQVLSLFEDEATVWISLEKHPYIVRAYLVERFNKLPYVITEYVRGPEGMEGDLRGWLGHPRLTLPVAVTMALQIAQGMQHAVRKVPNLVHRDLKPANILVSGDGKAMVTDFGLVNSAESGAGTPAYMSPEQWREDGLDARSDIYAYGCILFEMFTSHRLFPAMTERDWESAHLESTPAALTSLAPELPGEIDQYIRCCLEKDVMARPQDWDEVVTFFAVWYHRLTGKAVVLDFSSLALNAAEWLSASYSLGNLKHWEEMLLACDRALAIDPNNAGAWTNKSLALRKFELYEEANQACDRALTIDPNYAPAWAHKGAALLDLKHYEEAIQAYDRSLALDPNDAIAWISKGYVLWLLKRYDEAIQAYDRGLAIDQNNTDAWSNKGLALKEINRYEEAIYAYDRALAIDQNYLAAWNNKSIVLCQMERYEEALYAYDRVLMIDQNNGAVWNDRCNALRKLNRYEEAVQALDRALAIEPNDADRWYNKGLVLYDLNRYEEAIYAFDQALALDPNNAATWRIKNLVLLKLERYEEAIHACNQVLAMDQNDWVTCCDKGDALGKLNRYDESIHAYDRGLAINQNDSIMWNNKGIVLFQLKRYTEAIHAYDRALAINPTDEFALQARENAVAAITETR